MAAQLDLYFSKKNIGSWRGTTKHVIAGGEARDDGGLDSHGGNGDGEKFVNIKKKP